MEMLQEAGFHPLEVIRSATMYGAQALHNPKGQEIQFGVIRPGLLADLIILDENPVANMKVLYGTGAVRLNGASTMRPVHRNASVELSTRSRTALSTMQSSYWPMSRRWLTSKKQNTENCKGTEN
jgi:adenine deaminase